MTKYVFYLLLSFFIGPAVTAQETFPLYPGKVPNSKPTLQKEIHRPDAVVDTVISGVSVPTLAAYPATPQAGKKTPAVIICPGGGYGVLCIKMEGEKIARAFNKAGITAFVLKYRLPGSGAMPDPSMAPLQDLQQALKLVREQADARNIDKDRIGIMGFSAGGHLAATGGTHFQQSYIDNPSQTRLRPDFMILVYPVISFTDSIGHTGSRNNLLGAEPDQKAIRFFSNELHVTKETPPTLLVLPDDDQVVPPQNSFVFLKALREHKVPASLHLYAKGDHGFLQTPPFEEWFGRVLYWMREMQYIR
ncbi:alpha/beta hydrolase [Niabella drilacis]|uniref:Acetyl esterase/lipase n=1 Tax=Niabella drilacis (strain DSM 25811 / CCM 8410 / CCUG 62505 / LMG 26954 / E90) TaxID=1285928 RepID=A0A1G6TV05_NIADE|nr:alpha/beta hydrolase [Niabella drilacis]SDD32918.1 Acetyl esterase/lipase [Niabella drilacis]